MIQSMTGYGKGRATGQSFDVVVEIKSLNSKGHEAHFRLPGHFFQQEVLLRNYLQAHAGRGKFSVSVTIECIDLNRTLAKVKLNTELIRAYHQQLTDIQHSLGLQDPPTLSLLLSLPNVVSETPPELDDEEWKLLMEAMAAAVNALNQERSREGSILALDLNKNIDSIERLLALTEPFEATRIQNVRQRLMQSLAEIAGSVSISSERLEQELIFYLEKFDVNEEKVRIRAHIANFRTTLQEPESQGRKLTFIAQELWREVNTLGVKANQPEMQALVVGMKEEIEKIKEQLMNIL